MIFLERMKTNLILGVLLKDELSPDKKAFGDLFLEASGTREAVVRSSTGHFLLVDLPEGKHIITGSGEFYKKGNLTVENKQGKLTIDSKLFDAKPPLADLSLGPKSNYPFPEGLTVLIGRVVDTDYRPIAGASIKVKNTTKSTTSEDDGGFFIMFSSSDGDKNITITVEKDGYSTVQRQILLKKDSPTRIVEPIVLTKL